MVTVRGKSEVRAFMASVPAKMDAVLRGAARAGAKVVADEIKASTPSEEVRENLRIRSKVGDDHIKVTIDVKPGWARSLGIWLEWGTDPHFISVNDGQRSGRSVGRINKQVRENDGNASLVIGGAFVGQTVWHPGIRPQPVFRPSLDHKGAEAVAAAQAYINARISRGAINTAMDDGGDE